MSIHSRNARLSPKSRSGSNIFFHRKLGKPPVGPAGAGNRNAPRLYSGGLPDDTISYRCMGCSAGPHVLHIDPAGRRYGLFWPLARDQKRFSKALPNVELIRPEVLAREGRGIWQKRFWEHTIRDDRDYRAHIDYVHFNPVKHGLVGHPVDWPFSTCHKCVALGLYDAAWASPDITKVASGMGERL